MGEVDTDRRVFIVDGLFRSDTTALVYGKSMSGKTLAVADLCAALALGQCYFGKAVNERCGVLWIAAEKPGEADPRLRAACQRRGLGPEDRAPVFIFWPQGRLSRPEVQRVLWYDAERLSKLFRSDFGVRIGVVVIDTAMAAFELREGENSGRDVADVYSQIDEIKRRTGAAVLLIHHEPKGAKGGSAGPLGAHGWLANAGAALRCDAPHGSGKPIRTITLEKVCDGATPGPLGRFSFGRADLGNGDQSDFIMQARGRPPASDEKATARQPKANGKSKAANPKKQRSDEEISAAVYEAVKSGAKVRDLARVIGASRRRCQQAVADLLAAGKLVKTEPYNRIIAA